MDDFPKTLIIAIVVCIVVVLVVFGLIYYLALNWTKLVHRATPDSWASPPSEKVTWPQSRKSDESFYSSPTSSPRSSRMSAEPMMGKLNTYNNEPITPPRKARS